MEYLLGFDQGMTKTHAVIATSEGEILALGSAHGSCYAISGMEHAMAACQSAMADAFARSGLPTDTQFAAVAAGLTGCDFDYEEELLRTALSEIVNSPRMKVVNDCLPALRAGTRQDCCLVICAGTGLNCAVHAPSGEEFVFGYYLPDSMQSASAVGRDAIWSVLNAYSGLGVKTSMREEILAAVEEPDEPTLLHTLITRNYPGEKVAALARIVDRHACAGDSEALRILRTLGENMAVAAVAGWKRLAGHNTVPDLVLSGSVFKCQSPILKESFRETLYAAGRTAGLTGDLRITDALLEPIAGTVIYAAEMLGKDIDSIYPALLDSSEKHGLYR